MAAHPLIITAAWHYTAPFVGGIALETIYWYQLKEKLDSVKYRKMLASPRYWAVVLGMVIIGGLVGIYWGVSQDPVPPPFALLIAGAGAPSLVKNGLAALAARKKTKLGPADSGAAPITLRDYFSP